VPGERVEWSGFGTTYLIRGESTGARFALVEHDIGPRTLAAPLHTHRNEDEYSFVLEGRVGFQLGDSEREEGPGVLVEKPRGVPHAFWNPGDEPARLLELISPAGFERYFEELAPILDGGGPPDMEALAEVRGRYELDMDPSTIETLIQRHGLKPRG
jgi:quercetin dioxygenase-like cupin family protein